jgi:hypothetical protein
MEKNTILLVVDGGEPVTLTEFMRINSEAVLCKIEDLNKFIPLDEIISLNVGETYFSCGMGTDVKRIK